MRENISLIPLFAGLKISPKTCIRKDESNNLLTRTKEVTSFILTVLRLVLNSSDWLLQTNRDFGQYLVENSLKKKHSID